MSNQSGSRRKRTIRTGDEQDVHTGWRKLYCYTQRAGVTRKVKRLTNRRERFTDRRRLREGGE